MKWMNVCMDSKQQSDSIGCHIIRSTLESYVANKKN